MVRLATSKGDGLEPDEGIQIPVTWIGLDDVPVHYANQFVCQFQPDEFILSIGNLTPPMLLGPPDEQQKQLQQLAYVPIRPIARIAMTPSRLRELIQVLQQNLQQYESFQDTHGDTPR